MKVYFSERMESNTPVKLADDTSAGEQVEWATMSADQKVKTIEANMKMFAVQSILSAAIGNEDAIVQEETAGKEDGVDSDVPLVVLDAPVCDIMLFEHETKHETTLNIVQTAYKVYDWTPSADSSKFRLLSHCDVFTVSIGGPLANFMKEQVTLDNVTLFAYLKACEQQGLEEPADFRLYGDGGLSWPEIFKPVHQIKFGKAAANL